MSRPQKMHKPLGAAFADVLTAIGKGYGKGKGASRKPKGAGRKMKAKD